LNAGRGQQNRMMESNRDEKVDDDCGYKIDNATVRHIQMVTGLVEGHVAGLAEVAAMLVRILRQHSIDTAGKLPYATLCHQKNPP
jgi:hypothetical protein